MTPTPFPAQITRVTDPLLELIADHPEAAAAVAAFIGSWFLYGVLGKRALGADDDFWEQIRGTVLPMLDRLAATFPGFYAEGRSTQNELVGIVQQGEEEFERTLMALNYTRNPMASVKTNRQGWTENGSWAKRYAGPRWIGDGLRGWAAARSIPGPGLTVGMLGRFIQGLGDILALRQVHITFYADPDLDDTVWVYAHDEPNSLNPVTALAHYRATTQKKAKGVRRVRDTLSDAGVDVRVQGDNPVS
jgi:hypothetical protein